MKDYAEILIRARELAAEERERRYEQAQLRLPHRCTHNHRQVLDTRRAVEGEANPTYNRVTADGAQTIGLCMLGAEDAETWPGTICEDPIDAQRCPYYNPAQSLDEVLDELHRDLSNPEWLAANMPELSALVWVLEESTLPKLPWFRQFLLRFRRFKIEPLQPTVDPAKLLPDRTA